MMAQITPRKMHRARPRTGPREARSLPTSLPSEPNSQLEPLPGPSPESLGVLSPGSSTLVEDSVTRMRAGPLPMMVFLFGCKTRSASCPSPTSPRPGSPAYCSSRGSRISTCPPSIFLPLSPTTFPSSLSTSRPKVDVRFDIFIGIRDRLTPAQVVVISIRSLFDSGTGCSRTGFQGGSQDGSQEDFWSRKATRSYHRTDRAMSPISGSRLASRMRDLSMVLFELSGAFRESPYGDFPNPCSGLGPALKMVLRVVY